MVDVRQARERPVSLGSSSGAAASVLLSLLVCASHAFFAYAQLSGVESDCPGVGSSAWCSPNLPDDGLIEVRVHARVSYDARGLLASSLGTVNERVCGKTCPGAGWQSNASVCAHLSCDECAAVGGLALRQRCALQVDEPMMHSASPRALGCVKTLPR
jgi:hypothetical protein